MSISDKKKFIILQEDDKGFSFNSKKPSGYTKIESKDLKFKIFYYIQNLDTENTYGLNLILENDSKIEIISIGDVKTDENGKIDVSYDFDEGIFDSVCGSTLCVKDIKGDVKFPLSGFLPKKKISNWKVGQFRFIKSRPFRKEVCLVDKKKDMQVKEDKNSVESIDNHGSSFEEGDYTSNISPNSENLVDNVEQYNEYENEFICLLHDEDLTQDLRNEKDDVIDDYHNYEEVIKGFIDTSKESYEQAKYHVEAVKKLLEKDNGRIEKMIKNLFHNIFKSDRDLKVDYEYRFFLNILNDYEEIDSLDFNGFRVFKVGVDKFSQIENMKKHDGTKYSVVYYPMISMYPYFKNKGYFIVGIKCNEFENISNLLYGVEVEPGMENEFPYDGKTGFNKYIYDHGNLKGYHVMEYDYKKCLIK